MVKNGLDCSRGMGDMEITSREGPGSESSTEVLVGPGTGTGKAGSFASPVYQQALLGW